MKAEELLYCLDHVGDDLLAEADQSVRVIRPRPWRRIAATAAVLALVIGAGAWGMSRVLLRGRDSPATEPGLSYPVTEPGLHDVETEDSPATEAPPAQTELELLTLGDCLQDEYRARGFPDLEGYLALGAPEDGSIPQRLPVFEDLACPDAANDEALTCLTEDQREGLLRRAIALLGHSLSEPGEKTDSPESFHTEADRSWASLGSARLEVLDSGRIQVLFDDSLQPQGYEPKQNDLETAGRLLIQQVLGITELDAWRITAYTEFQDSDSSRFVPHILLCPRRQDPTEALLGRSFCRIDLSLNPDTGSLLRIEADGLWDPAGGYELPSSLQELDLYPIISPEKARALTEQGFFIAENSIMELFGGTDLSDSFSALPGGLNQGELVYCYGTGLRLLLPYYRFWLTAWEPGTHSGLSDGLYVPIYVPAVVDSLLTDYPRESYRPTHSPEGMAQADSLTVQILTALLEDQMGLLRRGLTSSYAEPRAADFYEMFRNGIPGADSSLRPEDEAWLRARDVDTVLENATRLDGSAVDEALVQLFGLDRAALAPKGDPGQLFPVGASWNPELDCYYFFVHDNSLGPLQVLHVWVRPGDAVVVEYQFQNLPDSGTWRLTLEPADGGYHIRSNLREDPLPVEESPKAPHSDDSIDVKAVTLAPDQAALFCRLPYQPSVDTPEDLRSVDWSSLLGASAEVENAEGELLRLDFVEEEVSPSGSMEYAIPGNGEETAYIVWDSALEAKPCFLVPASEDYRFTPNREDRWINCGVRWEDLFIQVSASFAQNVRIGRNGVELRTLPFPSFLAELEPSKNAPEGSETYWLELYLNGSRLGVSGEGAADLNLIREGNQITIHCTGPCQVYLDQYWKRAKPKRLVEEALPPNGTLVVNIPSF